MFRVSELYIYPVKSLGGSPVLSARVTSRGFEHDRRWMLVDHENKFISQRENSSLALLQVRIEDNGLVIQHKQSSCSLHISFQPKTNEAITVEIWDDRCMAQLVSEEADQWFSKQLSLDCRLVYMPDSTRRMVDPKYAFNNEITSFSDAYPFLLIGQSSLEDLNARMPVSLSMDRFRPNIVFTGGQAFEEDEFEKITINQINFTVAKPCARCPIPTIDQATGIKDKEPLLTLSKYRSLNNKVYFGQNLVHEGEGLINVNDLLTVVKRKQPLFSE